MIDLNDDYHLEFGQKVNSIIESKTSLDGDEGTKGAGSVAIDSSTGSRSGAFVKWGEAARTCTLNQTWVFENISSIIEHNRNHS